MTPETRKLSCLFAILYYGIPGILLIATLALAADILLNWIERLP